MQGTERIVKIVRGALTYGLGTKVQSSYSTVKFSRNFADIIFQIGKHARGNTANIAIENSSGEKLVVYSVIGGNPGWDEYYGWIKRGPWVSVIEKLMDEVEAEISKRENDEYEKQVAIIIEKEKKEEEKIKRFESLFVDIDNTNI